MPNFERKISEIDRKKDDLKIRTKSIEKRDAYQRVFDDRTVNLLIKLLNSEKIKEIVGIISQGKEANVYYAIGQDDVPLAIKIYKIDIQSARWMKNYIIGDPRFKKIGTSTDKIIYTWCKKEFRNLKQIYTSGMKCPEPFFFKGNILIMKYLGTEDGTPAQKLRDSVGTFTDAEKELKISIKNIKDMYEKANLIHGDYSEFNILYLRKNQYIIDVSQAVSKNHPKAKFFLSRDIKNIINFYDRIGIHLVEPGDIYDDIINDSM